MLEHVRYNTFSKEEYRTIQQQATPRLYWRVLKHASNKMAINMFRLLSRQAAKAVPRLSRIDQAQEGKMNLKRPISRRIHSVQLPYTGPPGYYTIVRRFSPQVDPLKFFTRKRDQETWDRGEFIDVHDVGKDPADFDVLITDTSHQTLDNNCGRSGHTLLV